MRFFFPSRGLYFCTACDREMLLAASDAAAAGALRLGAAAPSAPSPVPHPSS